MIYWFQKFLIFFSLSIIWVFYKVDFLNKSTFIYLFIFLLNLYSLTSFSGSIALTSIPKTVLNRRWSEAFCLIFSSWRERTQFLAIIYEVNYKSFVIFFIKMRTFPFISSIPIVLKMLGIINYFFPSWIYWCNHMIILL